jgi:soluble lytic murein transglycosylase
LFVIVFLFQRERVDKLQYPIEYEDTVLKYSEIYDVDPTLIFAIINVESKFNSDAVSNKGAIGLMQIMPDTGTWASKKLDIEGYTTESLYDHDTNIHIGTWYISSLLEEFNGDIRNAAAAYNGGIGNVRNWLKDEDYSRDGVNLDYIPFSETRNYVKKVIKGQGVYREIYGE